MLVFYIQSCEAATRALIPGWFALEVSTRSHLPAPSSSQALTWLEQERHNLEPLVRCAAEVGDLRSAWQLAHACSGYYLMRRHWNSYADTQEIALAAAQDRADTTGASVAMIGLGNAYAELGRTGEALDLHSRAVAHFEVESRSPGLIHALNGLGLTFAHLHRIDEAMRLAKRAFATARSDNPWGAGASLCLIGKSYLSQRRHRSALDMFERALEYSRATGSLWAEMRSRQLIAAASSEVGDTECSKRQYRAAIELSVAIGDRQNQGRLLCQMGNLHYLLGESRAARRSWEEAEPVLAESGDPLQRVVRYRMGLETAATA